MKIIFDSSTLISLSSSCLINVLKEIKENTGVELIIPKSVEFECVTHPLGINRFELNAVRIRKAVQDGAIQIAEKTNQRDTETGRLSRLANSIFYANGRKIEILQRGELEMLAIAKEIGAKILAVDERTARMIIENPSALQALISRRRHKKVNVNKNALNEFRDLFPGLSFVRSSELIAYAFEKGILEKELGKGKESVEAALYAVKFSGCGISLEEIRNYLREI